ncbi:class v [Moniliophthora roreri MCA 2997]|uniref:Class v n=1 Tax=Moniliophthora roreri (strain MCA 2997) TaxID=1381753 RepID=V2X6M9_MONRO|nr:class v [Moniliophthora roreri MCA 2997]
MRSLPFTLLAVLNLSLQVFAADPPADPFSCSPTQPCKIGCCGKNNVCGLGPDYCSAENCVSSCDQKSDCDPGWGPQWSAHEKCPLNVCCSKFGFCGTTEEFCGSNTVKRPSCSGNSATNRVVGYYEGWSTTRACDGMFPENIPLGTYTHLNYAFAFVDPKTFAVAPMAELDKELYPRFTALKQVNPGLETWISIGGWSMNDPDQPTATTFSDLAGSADAQRRFFSSLIQFMGTYGFDGVDIDWEYPVAPERSGKPADYANYISFLKNLKNALGSSGHKYGLTLTIPSSYWYMQHFDIVQMASIIDWFNVMSYDLHGTWDSTNPYIGPVINAHTNITEITNTLDLLWRNNIDPKQVVLGLGFYGRSFTLSDPSCAHAGCPFSAGGNPGRCTASAGTLSYSEIQDVIAAGAKVTLDNDAKVKNVVWDTNQWVSYDDEETLKMKLDYANGLCLGGVMVWAVSTDDRQGTAARALNAATGRTEFIPRQLAVVPSAVGQCIWGECGKDCPSGLRAAQRSDGKNRGNAGIYTGCSGGQTRNYCCPSNNVPTCEWRGTAPFCKGKCHDGEVEVSSDTSATGSSCWTGHKVLCCQETTTDSGIGSCHWEGSAPICAAAALAGPLFYYASASCPADKPTKITTGKEGAGGEQGCVRTGGFKSFCCEKENPYNDANCAWYQARSSWVDWAFAILPIDYKCQGECPAGKTPIAADSTGCIGGTRSYFCCDSSQSQNTAPLPYDNLCAVPDSLYLESNEHGDEADASDYTEVYLFEQDCFVSGEDDSEDPGSPGSPWEFKRRDLSMKNATEEYHELVKRGSSRLQAICGPGPVRTAKKNSFRASPYPTVKALIDGGKLVISQAKPIGCAVAGLATGSTKVPGSRYVTEHVTELQSVKSFAQSLVYGTLPGGGTMKQGVIDFTKVFDAGGFFQKTWSSLGVTPPAIGSTPEETIYRVLGTSADTSNLQVFDAKLNGLKAIIWAGSKNIIGVDNYKNLAPLDRIKSFGNIVDVFAYLNQKEVQDSLKASYDGMLNGWTLFQSALKAQGTNYDVVGAYKDWNTAQFANMVKVATDFLNDKIPAEVTYWASNQALKDHGKATVALAAQTLTNIKGNLGGSVKIATGFIH